jgi:hypothetical protein
VRHLLLGLHIFSAISYRRWIRIIISLLNHVDLGSQIVIDWQRADILKDIWFVGSCEGDDVSECFDGRLSGVGVFTD